MPKKGQQLSEEQKANCRIARLKQLYGSDVKCLDITHPTLAAQWHPTKNVGLPSQYTSSSDASIWWLCPCTCPGGCSHEWRATIGNRANAKSDCPFCSRKKICPHSSIVHTHPNIAFEYHPTRNKIGVNEIAYGSKKRVWWLCPKKCPEGCPHEYEAAPLNRCGGNKQGCPFCCNQQICAHLSIEATHPYVAGEWCRIKNQGRLPSQVSKGCSDKVWWTCSAGHSFEASIKNRCNGSGCPHCSYRVSKGEREWLAYMEVSKGQIQRQYAVIGTKSSLDGAQPATMTGYLYHGDYYHGNPKVYPHDAVNPTSKKTYGELFSRTTQHEKFFKESGWVLYIIWELDWMRGKQAVRKLQKIWRRRPQA